MIFDREEGKMICDICEYPFTYEKLRSLERELRNLFDDDEFVFGTFNDLYTEECVDALLIFITRNKDKMSKDALYEQVNLLSIKLEREYRRKNGIVYEWDAD